MRHLGIIASSAPQGSPPSVTVNAVTNFNQDRATFNGTVSANGAITTTIKFQISTNNSTWTDASGGTTISNTSSDNVSVFYNATGLSNGTLYYVRLVATNSIGTTTSSTTTFTTWSIKNYASATPGTTSFNIPTITPTGSSPVIPSIYNVFILGGGGGGGGTGGAGGGYRLVSSRSFSSTSNSQLTLVVGAGGAPNVPGGTTQITASNFTSIDAGGGGEGDFAYVGYGDNPAYQSGGSTSYTAGGKNDPVWFAYGGGAGIGGAGASGTAGNGFGTGGAGGAGGSAYGYSGGAGGGGWATTSGTVSNGSNYGYGSGGAGTNAISGNAGTAGLIRFQYFGP